MQNHIVHNFHMYIYVSKHAISWVGGTQIHNSGSVDFRRGRKTSGKMKNKAVRWREGWGR